MGDLQMLPAAREPNEVRTEETYRIPLEAVARALDISLRGDRSVHFAVCGPSLVVTVKSETRRRNG